MKVSKNWLKDYLNLDNYSDSELEKLINAHVCETESYEKMVEATCLTIGHVLECVEHPNSDHLHVCQVEIKPGEVSQIVCGAPNVAAGQKVIVALPGAVLPGDFKIKPAKVRGIESNGMICSLQELGIEEKYIDEDFKHGIYVFDDEAEVGGNPLEYLGFDDYIIDLDLTSNRSDLLSVEGVAFDLGAVLNQTVTTIIPEIEEAEEENPITVKIETNDCYQYHARHLTNVKIAKSPMWMQARLIASGVRPINNVVDITNFVLMEMGQPLHAFDADELGNNIVVRNAYKDEKITTLDGIERVLEETDVLITDGQKPVCLAGVMGGLESEVTDKTVNITLEAAEFAPLAVRKTSSRLGLKSESSVRFERKIDSLRVKRALDYAAQLMCELCDASISSGVKSAYTKDYTEQVVEITADKVNRVLGTSLTDSEVNEIFDRLAYTYAKEDLVYKIVLPSRRMDLEPSVQDIIEDVARMYGYDNIPTTIAKTRDKGALTYKQRRVRLIRQILANMGLNETVTYSLIAEKNLYLYTLEEKEPIKVLMPMTEDRAVMRESLLNGVVDAIAYNKARKLDNLAFFEIGNVYSTEKEELKLAGAMSGLFTSHLWNGVKQEASFYAAKGVLDALFAKINVSVIYKPYKEQKSFHPGRTAGIYMNNKLIGVLGEIHPRLAKELGVGRTIAYELSLEDIVNEAKEFKYQPINKFPSVTRDLAIVVKKDVLCEDVLAVVRQTARKYLTSLELFDVYTGEGVEADEKSLAFKMTFEDSTKTLETQDVDKVIKSILNRLDFNFKARLR